MANPKDYTHGFYVGDLVRHTGFRWGMNEDPELDWMIRPGTLGRVVEVRETAVRCAGGGSWWTAGFCTLLSNDPGDPPEFGSASVMSDAFARGFRQARSNAKLQEAYAQMTPAILAAELSYLRSELPKARVARDEALRINQRLSERNSALALEVEELSKARAELQQRVATLQQRVAKLSSALSDIRELVE